MGSRGGGFLSLVVANGAIYNRIIIPGTTRLLTPRRGPGQARGDATRPPSPSPGGEGASRVGQPGRALPFLSATSPCPRLQLNPLSLLQGHRLGFALLSSPPAEDAGAAPLAAGATRQDRGHAAAGLPVSLPPAEEQRRFGAGAQSQASPGSSSPRAPQGPGLARRARGRQ